MKSESFSEIPPASAFVIAQIPAVASGSSNLGQASDGEQVGDAHIIKRWPSKGQNVDLVVCLSVTSVFYLGLIASC